MNTIPTALRSLILRLFGRRWFHAESGEEVDAVFRPGPEWWRKTRGITSVQVEPSRSPFHAEARRYCEHMGLTEPEDLHAAIRELEEKAKATQPTDRG